MPAEGASRHLLVTGGAGFSGGTFIRHWLARYAEDRITNLDLLTYAADLDATEHARALHGGRYRLVRGDIADAKLVSDLVGDGRFDAIVNFAAESHNSRGVLDPAAFTRTNVLGTQTLLEAARRAGVKRFHHISTCEVYGDLSLDSDASFDEAAPYRPRTPYNASKASADLLVRAYFETFGLPITISNSSNNYGPRQHPEKLIPLFATNALEDRPLPIYSQSANRREWLHVDDHCRAVELVLLRGRIGETYNVGSGAERSIEEIADAILRILGKPASLKRYVPDRPGHDRRYLLDHTKIRSELGWAPTIGFDEGLAATVEWYRSEPQWWREKKARLGAELSEFDWSAPPQVR